MDILLMGTAAAEGLPAAYCDCVTCTEARRRGGKDIRTRAGTLIDHDLKIDHGPDTVVHMQRAGRSLASVGAILITHNHPDHLYATELKRAFQPSTTTRPDVPLPIYGPESVLDYVRRGDIPDKVKQRFDLHRLEPLVPATTPMGDIVLPLPASHSPDSFIFRITRKGKTVLYGHDTGLYQPETLEALADGVHLDVALMDCTIAGVKCSNQHHMNIEGVLLMVKEMRDRKAITERTRVVVTHFSHNGHMLHDELVEAVRPYGMEVAYDGMKVTI